MLTIVKNNPDPFYCNFLEFFLLYCLWNLFTGTLPSYSEIVLKNFIRSEFMWFCLKRLFLQLLLLDSCLNGQLNDWMTTASTVLFCCWIPFNCSENGFHTLYCSYFHKNTVSENTFFIHCLWVLFIMQHSRNVSDHIYIQIFHFLAFIFTIPSVPNVTIMESMCL